MRHRDETSLVGWYFQSFAYSPQPPGTMAVDWQGRVVSRPEPGWYLIQFRSLLDKDGPMLKLVKFERMAHWEFYPDSDSMMAHYEKLEAQAKESQTPWHKFANRRY